MEDIRRLDERIPEKGFKGPDEMLDAFLGWVADRGLELYPHQEEAILELFAGHHVILDAPTGSGKSLVATALHFKTFAETGKAWYTAPIKALVSEKFFELCSIFGAEFVGMMTGDGTVNRDAPILCCTAEILANLAMREGEDAPVTSVVMDEFHYYADRDRGMAWQVPLLTLPRATFLLMSGTLGDTRHIRDDLQERSGREVAEVFGATRPVPLQFTYSTKVIHETLSDLVRENKAPIYLVHFTQSAATEQAQALMSVDYSSKEEKAAIKAAVRGFSFHSPFGPTLRRYVMHGIGLHHAGLLPRYRRLVERLAQQGLLKIICGTDTLGVGINVPIRTVLFTQLCKFDGEKVTILPVRDFKQIAGRAGRKGYDDVGYVVVQAPAHVIENQRAMAAVADNPKKKRKLVKKQPPNKGYKHWDETTFQQLVERPPEPLQSRFTVDHGRLLSLMQYAEEAHGDARLGVDRMLALIEASHSTKGDKREMTTQVSTLLEQLEGVGVVRREGEVLRVDPTLQHDFSLHHTLSLFLLDALASVDLESDTHALDVLSWVEAILDHPRPVLYRQVSREKGKLIAALKEQGVPYEDRMAALDEVSWPKPMGETIYAWYNAYREKHPWVSEGAIRPKSVAREMVEQYASFSEYVRELGLQRAEGVLLRYLSEVYKALVQNVPTEVQTDAVLDVTAYLRATLAHVDASLLTEWEAMLSGADAPPDAPPPPVDISADPKRFKARVRAELHSLVRAIALGDFEEAAASVRRGEDDPWGPQQIEAAVAPFVEEHGAVGFDHRARLAHHTVIDKVGPHQWTVRQRLLPPDTGQTAAYRNVEWQDEEDLGAFEIEGQIDLRSDTNPEGPLVELTAIGE